MSDKNWIILLVLLVVLYKLMRWQETNKRWPAPLSPPPRPQNQHWNHIHLDFDNRLTNQWQQQGYDYQEAEKWIGCGVKPNELELVQWIKEVKRLNPDYIINRWGSSGVNPLRCEWKISKLPPGTQGFY